MAKNDIQYNVHGSWIQVRFSRRSNGQRTREKMMDIHSTLCCGGETKEGGRGDRAGVEGGRDHPPPPFREYF